MNTIDKLHKPHPMSQAAAAALAEQCRIDERDGWTYDVVCYACRLSKDLYVVDVRDEDGFYVGAL